MVQIYHPRWLQRPPSLSEPATRTHYPFELLWAIPRSSSASPGVRGRWCGGQERFRCSAGSRWVSAVYLGASAVEPAATTLYPRSPRLVCVQIGPEPDDIRKFGRNIPLTSDSRQTDSPFYPDDESKVSTCLCRSRIQSSQQCRSGRSLRSSVY